VDKRTAKHEGVVTVAGIDLAKNVFGIHGFDDRGQPVLRRRVRRDQLLAEFANRPPCLIGVEACSGAHHWARELERLGHTVRLMAPEFVKPFRKSRLSKNDANDAEAIATAVQQSNMRFVPRKSLEQQAMLTAQRRRSTACGGCCLSSEWSCRSHRRSSAVGLRRGLPRRSSGYPNR
jgi:transposase